MEKHTEYIERLERIEKKLDELMRKQPIIIDNSPKWPYYPFTFPMELPEPKYPVYPNIWYSLKTGDKTNPNL